MHNSEVPKELRLGDIIMSKNIPVLHITGKTLPEAWEKAVLTTWEQGLQIRTQYDKPEDPPSRDATVVIQITEPLAEPRLHRSFPAGLEELEIYRQEVVNGVHDSWINPADKKWSYTYHQRLFSYDVIDNFDNALEGGPLDSVNQIGFLIDNLVRASYTRRAQAITWMPTVDKDHHEPPCLQRIWTRIVIDEQGVYWLNMNTHWRSRDAYKAAYMNMYALTDLQRMIAEEIGGKLGREVRIGQYIDISDSFHIYGSYFDEFQQQFLNILDKRSFEERVWNTADVEYSLAMGKVQLLNGKPGEPDLPDDQKLRIWREIPEEYRGMVQDTSFAE